MPKQIGVNPLGEFSFTTLFAGGYPRADNLRRLRIQTHIAVHICGGLLLRQSDGIGKVAGLHRLGAEYRFPNKVVMTDNAQFKNRLDAPALILGTQGAGFPKQLRV